MRMVPLAALSNPASVLPPPEPQAIRACLMPDSVDDLLHKWRHFAYSEHTLVTGKAPAGYVTATDIKALIDRRLG